MQKYYSTVSSKMKIRTIEDYIIKSCANSRHILCPQFKSYFVKNKVALFLGDWEGRAKIKGSRLAHSVVQVNCPATTYLPTSRLKQALS